MNTTSSYENAPATQLVATHCALCGRKLVNADSLRLGVGPDCAERVGLSTALRNSVEADIANEIIYKIAANQKNWNVVAPLLNALRAVPTFGPGLETVIQALEEKLTPKEFTIEITLTPLGNLKIVAPYVAAAVTTFKNIPGRKFGKETVDGKEVAFNIVPKDQKRALQTLLSVHYQGAFAKGPKGIFQIA